jgi:hypothetical protein
VSQTTDEPFGSTLAIAILFGILGGCGLEAVVVVGVVVVTGVAVVIVVGSVVVVVGD